MALFIDQLAISTPDFASLSRIPDQFSGYNDNCTPAVEIQGAPNGTVELAVICHDPDAPLPHGFTHWTVYGIPADTKRLDPYASGVRIGPNSVGKHEWTGPMPPPGHGRHHYYFWVYALRRPVEGTPSREEFLHDHGDAIIEQARTIGTFDH